jgi:putative oxidoreductase
MPYLTVARSIILLRIAVALIFLAHALVRIGNHTMERFAGFLDNKGFVYGTIVVWAITVFEIAGGILLALGYYTRTMAIGFILLLIMGIILIHFSMGWFVGEHGTGGMEYSFILIMALLPVIAADKRSPQLP